MNTKWQYLFESSFNITGRTGGMNNGNYLYGNSLIVVKYFIWKPVHFISSDTAVFNIFSKSFRV